MCCHMVLHFAKPCCYVMLLVCMCCRMVLHCAMSCNVFVFCHAMPYELLSCKCVYVHAIAATPCRFTLGVVEPA